MYGRGSKIDLDNPQHIFVIAEAGSNWRVGSYKKDLKRARDLIKVAAKAGADAIKFQTFRPETVYVKNAGKSSYLSKSGIKKNIFELFKEYSMPYEMLKDLAKICYKNKINFMSTSFSVQDARVVNKYVKVHKVAAFELNHIRLLEFLAKTKKPIILSTGDSNLEEITFAVKLLKKKGAKKIALLQGTSKYPAPIDSLNLKTIPQMRKKYHLPVGLSDHSLNPSIAPLLAVGFGATIIEKHFTLNKRFKGPDHSFALNPEELTIMVSIIRNAEKAFGDGIKKILKTEHELRNFATRSVQAIRNISRGDVLKEGYNIEVLRSGNQKRGADARFLFKIIGKKALRNIRTGQGISLQFISK